MSYVVSEENIAYLMEHENVSREVAIAALQHTRNRLGVAIEELKVNRHLMEKRGREIAHNEY